MLNNWDWSDFVSKTDNKIENSSLQSKYKLNLENNTYIINNVIFFDDEATTYTCKLNNDKEYYVKELFPRSLCVRESDGKITAISGKEVQYKNLFEDMLYIWESIYSSENCHCLNKPIQVCKYNNTVYAVLEKTNLKSVEECLKESGKPWKWSEIKQKYIKLCRTVNYFHTKSIIHRGISDQTVFVNENGDFVLTSFSTAANRTEKSEIKATLYEGFSAPEQYSPKLWQGEWTDIYSLACLLYKMLTGSNVKKDEEGKIVDATAVNPDIPEYVSDAISACLNEKTNLRTQCIDDLTAMLLEDTSSNTMVFPMTKAYQPEPKEKFQVNVKEFGNESNQKTTIINLNSIEAIIKGNDIDNKNEKHEKIKLAILFTMLILSLVLLYSVIYKNNKTTPITSESSSEPEEIYEFMPFESYNIDNFVGIDVKSVIENESYNQKYKFYIKEDYNDTYSRGQIVSQSPKANTKAVNKSNIIITVSKGARTIVMPDIIGKDVSDVETLLKKYGVKYQIIEIYNKNLPSGTVRSCNFDTGSTVDIFNDTVFIYAITSLNNDKEK